MQMLDFRSRRRSLLQRMRWAILNKIDAKIEARAERRLGVECVRLSPKFGGYHA